MTSSTSRGSTSRRLAPEERRRQIVEATIACLARTGPDKWTLRQVSRDIGIAPSLVTYLFSTWNDLLIATYKTLSDRFDQQFSAISHRPGMSARERLDRYIDAYFDEEWLADEIAGAYIAFWSLARGEPRLREVMDDFGEMKQRDLVPLMREYADELGVERDIQAMTDIFYFLLSGLWYELAVNPGSTDAPDPRSRARQFLDVAFAPPG
ncbi:TetR family transcriptional regulator C-terminal domain-containing protein [Rhodobacteraceae bacterium NNCM2]|nr:TetR family transcriptional regulator C-terminal domain-containing protein [Coraliihabitans acroporae]